jgi:flagellum-specific peptidoglycan hydrolase FlgJ
LDSEGNPTAPPVVPANPVRHSNASSFTDQNDFVQQMTNAYAAELQRRGYDPAFAEYLVAQDALESS